MAGWQAIAIAAANVKRLDIRGMAGNDIIELTGTLAGGGIGGFNGGSLEKVDIFGYAGDVVPLGTFGTFYFFDAR